MIGQVLQAIGLTVAFIGVVFAIGCVLDVIDIKITFEKDDDAA